MIKQEIITDALTKITNQKKTIKEVVPNPTLDGKKNITVALRKQLKKIITDALSKALVNYSDSNTLKWTKEWNPHSTKKGLTSDDIESVEVEIKGVPNITVGNLIHANDNIQNKLEKFIAEFEKPTEETKKTISKDSFPEKVGVLKWRSANSRKKVYDYWEDISKMFDDLESQTRKWAETLTDKNKGNVVDSLENLENYVIKINDVQQIPVGTHLDIFADMLEEIKASLLSDDGVVKFTENKILAAKTGDAADDMDDVDPLLAVSISKGLTKLGYSKETLLREKENLLEQSKKLDEKPREMFEKMLDSLIDEAEAIDAPFYLPDTEFTSTDEQARQRREDNHKKYLEMIALAADEKEINPVLLTTLKKYYGPISKTNMNLMGSPPKFMESSTWDNIMSLDSESTLDYDDTLVSAKQMEALAEFIGKYRKGALEVYDDNTKDLAYKVFGVLDELFKGEHRKANQETLGWFLNKNNPPAGERFMGESIEELADRYDEQKESSYPLLDMEGLINSPKFISLFEPTDPDAKLENVKPTVKKKLFEQVKKLNNNYKKLAKKKKDINSQILETHDVIRKSFGKPIYYGMNDLTDIEDTSYVLKRLSSRGYDLTAVELTAIVESISSFDRIAKSFGVNEETVYLAKGLCR